MARALHIHAKNVKNLPDAPFALEPALLVLGDMGVGKTGWLDALWLDALGYHPRAGRGFGTMVRTEDILARLGDGKELDVEVIYDTGEGRRTVRRRWAVATKDGELTFPKVATTVAGGGQKARTGKEAEAEVARLIGEPTFLDVREWLSLSDDKRTPVLLRHLGAGGWASERLWAELAPVVTPAALQELWDRKEVADLKEAGGACRLWHPDESLIEWLQAEHGLTSAAALAYQRQMQGLAKALEQPVEGEPIEPHRAAELKAALEQAKSRRRQTAEAYAGQVAELQQALAEVDRQLRERAVRTQELQAIRLQLRDAEAAPEMRSGVTSADLEGAIVRLEHGGWGVVDSLPALRAALQAAQQAASQAEAELHAADEQRQQTSEALSAAQEARNQAAQQGIDPLLADGVAEARVNVRLSEQAVAQLQIALQRSGWGSRSCCPTCGAALDQTALPRAQASLQQAQAALAAASEQEQQARALLEQRRVALQAIVDQEGQAVLQAQRAVLQARDALKRRTAEGVDAGVAVFEAQQRLEQLRTRLASLGREAAEHTARLEGLRQHEGTLLLALTYPEPDRTQLAAQLAGLQQQARAADEQAGLAEQEAERAYVAAHRQLERQQLLAQQAADLETARELRDRCKEMARALGPQGLQAKLLAEAIQPLTGPVNEAIEGLGLGVFGVRLRDERGKPCCQPGLTRPDGTWTHLESLSGGEQAIMLPLFLAGLAAVGRAPWRLVAVDGIEQVPLAHREPFLARLRQLLAAGRIDQVICTGCPDQPPVAAGYQIIHVQRPVKAEASA